MAVAAVSVEILARYNIVELHTLPAVRLMLLPIHWELPISMILVRLLSELLVLLRSLQLLQLLRIRELDLRKPALSFGRLVDRRRLILQRTVRFNNGSAHGSHNIGCGFYGFDSADGVTFGHFEVGGGKLDEDDIAEGVGGVVGNTNCA